VEDEVVEDINVVVLVEVEEVENVVVVEVEDVEVVDEVEVVMKDVVVVGGVVHTPFLHVLPLSHVYLRFTSYLQVPSEQ